MHDGHIYIYGAVLRNRTQRPSGEAALLLAAHMRISLAYNPGIRFGSHKIEIPPAPRLPGSAQHFCVCGSLRE